MMDWIFASRFNFSAALLAFLATMALLGNLWVAWDCMTKPRPRARLARHRKHPGSR